MVDNDDDGYLCAQWTDDCDKMSMDLLINLFVTLKINLMLEYSSFIQNDIGYYPNWRYHQKIFNLVNNIFLSHPDYCKTFGAIIIRY